MSIYLCEGQFNPLARRFRVNNKYTKMKKLSLLLLLSIGFLSYSTAQTTATETTKTVKAEKPSCYQPCSSVANVETNTPFYYVLTAAANQEMANTPEQKPMTDKEKAECIKKCKKTVAVNGKCEPKDCPPECLPPNCKIVSCKKTKATAMAINETPSNNK